MTTEEDEREALDGVPFVANGPYSEVFEIYAKRCYLPGVVVDRCSGCQVLRKTDLRDQYIAYPRINAPNRVSMHCPTCDRHWTVRVTLTLKISPTFEEEKDPDDAA